jgi:hypothetical protein
LNVAFLLLPSFEGSPRYLLVITLLIAWGTFLL